MKIILLDATDSTNEYCKRTDDGTDVTVAAARQTAGRGTKGRSFVSDGGGLYVSVMRHYKDFPAEKAFGIMVNACVAVCKTLEAFGISPVIRWANDVLADGKKICGTLIENTFSGGRLVRSIVGTGLNINNALPEELSSTAVSMGQCLHRRLRVEEVRDVFIRNAERQFGIADYKSYMPWLGQTVMLRTEAEQIPVTALDIAGDGRLIVKRDGNILKISAAEVSLRL